MAATDREVMIISSDEEDEPQFKLVGREFAEDSTSTFKRDLIKVRNKVGRLNAELAKSHLKILELDNKLLDQDRRLTRASYHQAKAEQRAVKAEKLVEDILTDKNATDAIECPICFLRGGRYRTLQCGLLYHSRCLRT
jgi:hypothetical protein